MSETRDQRPETRDQSRLRVFLRRVRNKLKKEINIFVTKSLAKELKDYSFVSYNCFASLHSKILNLENKSPFVGLFLFDITIFSDNNLQEYLSKDLKMIDPKQTKHKESLIKTGIFDTYPIGVLEDIELHFLHYTTNEEVLEKWNRRKTRINYDKLILIGEVPKGATTDFYKIIVDVGYDTTTLYKKGKKMILKNFSDRDASIIINWDYWSPIFRGNLRYRIALWWFIKYY